MQLVRDYLRDLGVGTADFEQEFKAYEHDYGRKLRRMDDGGKSVEAAGQEAKTFLVPLAGRISSKVNSLGLRRFGGAELRQCETLAGDSVSEAADLEPPASLRQRNLRGIEFAQKRRDGARSGI